MSYVIIEYDKIMGAGKAGTFFALKCAQLEEMSRIETENVWKGVSYGGWTPGTNQYGRTTHLPEWYADENADVLDHGHIPATWGRNSFEQYYTSTSPAAYTVPGWKTILQGALAAVVPFGGQVPEDIRIHLMGIGITTKASKITKIRMEIGDTLYPKMDIEERHGYNKPSIIFEEGMIAPEETTFVLRGWFEADGYERVVPLGFVHYRRKDLVIREP